MTKVSICFIVVYETLAAKKFQSLLPSTQMTSTRQSPEEGEIHSFEVKHCFQINGLPTRMIPRTVAIIFTQISNAYTTHCLQSLHQSLRASWHL
jgi:hypothetical protein